MKQLVILSGKGGTGKTSLAGAFAHLAYAHLPPVRAVLADADVDAANLELLLRVEKLEEHEFMGGSVAVIDEDLCQGCGICEQACRFEAILPPGYPGAVRDEHLRSPVFDLPDLPGAVCDRSDLRLVFELSRHHDGFDVVFCDFFEASSWEICWEIRSHCPEGGLILRFQRWKARRMAWSSQASTRLSCPSCFEL